MRLSYLLAAPLVVLSSSAQILNRDFAIEGCVGLTTILNPALGIAGQALTGLFTTESACAAACRSRGSQYAFFLGGQVLSTVTSCACSDNAPQLSQLLGANVAVNGAGTAGICGTLGLEAIRLNTDFTLRACAAANAFTNTAVGQTGQVTTVPQCLAQCAAFAYAIVNYGGACTCATGTQLTNAAGVGACSRTGASNAIYFNGLFPVASRTARKRDFDTPVQKALGLCPTGLQACLVGDESAVGTEAFEEAEVECPEGGRLWLQPGRQRLRFSIALPPTLPRNSRTPTGRLLYWLVGTIEGLPDGENRPKPDIRPSSSDNIASASAPSSSSNSSATSALPSYSKVGSDLSDVEWLRGSVRSDRRIAISHNPNPEGGVTRMDDDFTHNLAEFGTCRFQTRVNEWCTGCLFPLRFTCLALSPLAALFSIRVKLEETVTITPPSTGRPTVTKQSFTVVEQGRLPQPLASHPPTDHPTLWRGVQAGGSDRGDFLIDTIGKLPLCGYDQSLPSTLPGMYMPKIGVPVRVSHKLVYEIYFSVFGKDSSGAKMAVPGQGGLQVMRRNLATIVPQCVFVSEVLNLPSYSTIFGENIHRTDQYFYHRIEANLPCPTCHMVPLDNLCATCPGDIAVHVQHSMPLPRGSLGEGSSGKSKHSAPVNFDPACESCPTCSGQSVLPAQDPNFHLCGCEIEGREAAYHVIWDEPVSTIAKVGES